VPKQPAGDGGVGRMQFLLDLRRRGITDVAVLRALDEVPREHFVETRFADAAYADRALPIACGQTISQPFVVAYMTEQLGVRPEHRVLEVGTGSGYQAAVLSRLAREVVTVERYRTLADEARKRLATLGYPNVEVRVADADDQALLAGARPDPAHAESCFRRAVAVAGAQQARCLELRAAMSLARLWQRQGRRHDARRMLAESAAWFSEDLETGGLRDARRLLHELA